LDTKELLRRYISHHLLDGHDNLDVEENLLTSGMIDSHGIMRLIAYIEETFGLQVPPIDITLENFRTITLIADYIHSMQKLNQKEKGG
jgi:acyl carrier protein